MAGYGQCDRLFERVGRIPDAIWMWWQTQGWFEPFPSLDSCGNSKFIYLSAADVYLMFPSAFSYLHSARGPWFHMFGGAHGPLAPQLIVGRDGIHWTRPDRSRYIAQGMGDEWDLAEVGLCILVCGATVTICIHTTPPHGP